MKNKIIIFDDDAEILHICAIILESKGFDVVTETSCENVVQKVMASDANVILMDNSIPDTGGVIATRSLKQSSFTHHIPVIFFSANSNVAALSEQAGAEFYLAKPFDITELEDAVWQALNKNSKVAS